MNACRHGWFPGSILAVAIVLLGLAPVDAMHLKENPKRHRILYQLDEAGVDKAKFVLGNIGNHVTGVGGWQNIESLEHVVCGTELKSFMQGLIAPALNQVLERLHSQRMTCTAC